MLRIAEGRVYDPANGIEGEVRDICLDGGKVVEDLPPHAPRIDARGMVVMPGGVDIHSHIAGPAVNAARKLSPEEHRADAVDRTAIMRSGTGGTVPSTFTTGYRYALLGYTTVVDAATPPLLARHTLANGRLTARGAAPALAAAARDRGAGEDQIALAAALARPWADVVLSGAATVEQLQSNLGAAAVEWDEALEHELAALAEPADEYWAARSRLAWN